MDEPKRYHEMTKQERFADSDSIAVMELEKQLRKEIKQKYTVEIKENDLTVIIEDWLKKYLKNSEIRTSSVIEP